ncbi:PREDICTED: basic helix-loop-helix and HMG box domain-containing protein 1-like [Bison bison bison]|uniref:Basic helix-loop-helix and HMG box domain-containing protein 1-like n=1 Tax=Bison bison bison TaxID=43346 RepID=A0A6P3IGG1_BISBB|nr:PREDICTED: basic helix-loop-helix and HMG box domain-containing protein 1-like [Bison bison bison]
MAAFRCQNFKQNLKYQLMESSSFFYLLTQKQRKNHTSKLQELALMLPVTLKTGTKKLTKKEVLLHILQYIHYLQSSINVTKALLQLHANHGHGELEERQTRAQNPRRCLALEKPEKLETPSPDQKGGNVVGTTTPPRCWDSCSLPRAEASSSQGDRKGGRCQLTLLDVAESSIHCDISSCCVKDDTQDLGSYPAFEAQQGVKMIHFLNKTQPGPRQKLVFYDSGEEVGKESPNADPWIPAWTAEGSPQESPLALGPSRITNGIETDPLQEILGLSPSLFSSPGKLLSEQILEDGNEYLTQALFEEILLDSAPSPSACILEEPQKKDTPPEIPKDPPDSHDLGHENSKVPSSPGSEDMDPDLVWRQQEDTQADLEGLQSSSDDGDYTWTPTRRVSPLPMAGRKARKGRASRRPPKSKESKKAPGTPQMKKKCVNGFIMFCRMNRKQYIRACPGTASTAATKELAQLWRVMTLQERKPYCTKARRFSRQHNRIVKQDSSSSEDEDWETPKPFYQLLAEKARGFPDPVSPESQQGEHGSQSQKLKVCSLYFSFSLGKLLEGRAQLGGSMSLWAQDCPSSTLDSKQF